jgi:hypothetical protein
MFGSLGFAELILAVLNLHGSCWGRVLIPTKIRQSRGAFSKSTAFNRNVGESFNRIECHAR